MVWDNASDDGTPRLVRELAPEATIVEHDENLGFARAVNASARLVPGRDLLLLNPDAVVRSGSIALLRDALASLPAAAVAAGIVVEGTEIARPAWRFPTAGRACLGALTGLGRAYRAPVDMSAEVSLLTDAFTPFTFVLLRRTAFDQLGGLDERFWLYGEDADFCYRATAVGWSVCVVGGAAADHTGRGSSESRASAVAVQLRSEDRFREIHSGPLAATLAGWVILAGALGRLWLRRLGRGSDTAWQWAVVARHYLGRSSKTSA